MDVGNSTTRITRSANLLRNLLPGADTGVIELTAKAVARLAISSGLNSAEYVEFEVKRAIEWLGADRNENRRQSAVSGDRGEVQRGREGGRRAEEAGEVERG